MTLQAQSVALATELAETERIIANFSRAHFAALGDVLAKLLDLRVELHRRRARATDTEAQRLAYEEAKSDRGAWDSTRQAIEDGLTSVALTVGEHSELKRLFREASMLCHPDRVAEGDREEASAVFVRLRAAYRQGDLAAVRGIHEQLRKGRLFAVLSESIGEGELLRRQVSRLRLSIDQQLGELNTLHQTDTWQSIQAISNWDDWFKVTRARFVAECQILRERLDKADE